MSGITISGRCVGGPGCVYDHGDWQVAHPEMIDFPGSLLSLMYLQQTTQSSLSVLSLNCLPNCPTLCRLSVTKKETALSFLFLFCD